jgi:hypothetical protein
MIVFNTLSESVLAYNCCMHPSWCCLFHPLKFQVHVINCMSIPSARLCPLPSFSITVSVLVEMRIGYVSDHTGILLRECDSLKVLPVRWLLCFLMLATQGHLGPSLQWVMGFHHATSFLGFHKNMLNSSTTLLSLGLRRVCSWGALWGTVGWSGSTYNCASL